MKYTKFHIKSTGRRLDLLQYLRRLECYSIIEVAKRAEVPFTLPFYRGESIGDQIKDGRKPELGYYGTMENKHIRQIADDLTAMNVAFEMTEHESPESTQETLLAQKAYEWYQTLTPEQSKYFDCLRRQWNATAAQG